MSSEVQGKSSLVPDGLLQIFSEHHGDYLLRFRETVMGDVVILDWCLSEIIKERI